LLLDPNIALGSPSVPDAASISHAKGIPKMSEIPVPKQYEHWFKPGQSGNPKSKPRDPNYATRFMESLKKGGSKAIIQAMTEVGAFFLDKASRLYEQRPVRLSSSSSHKMAPSTFGVSFGLTGKSKRNLINIRR
jgi:hypothetical protein